MKNDFEKDFPASARENNLTHCEWRSGKHARKKKNLRLKLASFDRPKRCKNTALRTEKNIIFACFFFHDYHMRGKQNSLELPCLLS